MLERYMEEAIANCPELFIENGLMLVRRQVVINGRRPDLLFSDAFSRDLLDEVQRGRLDENHLQRHFYYYFDYRAKYPAKHLRLMFIANKLVPQHKEFLDEHGYEYREYPEGDFERRISECKTRTGQTISDEPEIVTTPGVVEEGTYQLLYEIEMQSMTLCYKMLLLMLMAEFADAEGRVSLRFLAEKFRAFFFARSAQNKPEENPNRIKPGALSKRSIREWERVIRDQPVHYLTESFLVDEKISVRWTPRIWSQWNPGLREELRQASLDRLVRYFTRHVPGGY